jgi:hypothetical protein
VGSGCGDLIESDVRSLEVGVNYSLDNFLALMTPAEIYANEVLYISKKQ